jgi:hypothetical protein
MQQWFNLAGLSFDFIGVIMLAYEWWIALSNERRLAQEAEFERRIRPNPVFQQQMQQNNPHAPMHEHMRENLRLQREAARAHGVRGMRHGWFAAAMVCIALGFLMQMIGSWPGGIGF